MRAVNFLFLFLLFALVAADSYDEVKAKIQDLIDDGFGKDDGGNKRSTGDVDTDSSSSIKKEKKIRNMDWPSDDEDFFGDSGDYDSYYKSRYEDKSEKTSDNEDAVPSMSRSQQSETASKSDSGSSFSKSSSNSDSSSDEDYYKNHYKNGKKKGFLGKMIDKVSQKLKSIPAKVAAGAAVLSGKVVNSVARIPGKVVDGVGSLSGKVVDGVVSIPGKVVDGVKSIPSKAKNILPGGKKKNGDITLNDYTQENHYHVHKDKHYHEELHRHQDDSTNLNVYNNWDGDDLDREYGSVYGGFRSKRNVKDSSDRVTRRKQLHKKTKPSERKAVIFF